ncbi:hypothetical protein LCGC14_0024130 [marine sediment metagenome]|uniref:Uncharacterized protein n=1 Tax=marine sediment metagenome TaxID=412755 RepID=A0A0F9W3K0_9ZZZZ
MPHNHRNQFGAARPDAHFVRAAVAGRYASIENHKLWRD